ncbi:MAG: hypothetical protein ACT4P1_16370 [Sporichthyaceae bacterium]
MSGLFSHVRGSSSRRPRARSIAVAGAVAALSVGLLAPAATAGEQAPMREAAPAGSDPNGTDYEISGLLSLDGAVAKLTNLTSVSQVVDSLGRAIGSPQSLALRASSGVDTPTLGKYSCVYQGQASKKVRLYDPQVIYRDFGFGKVVAVFHTYKLKDARTFGGSSSGRYKSTQYEVCGVGSGDLEGKRMRKVGLGIAAADAAQDLLIGSEWRTGETPENYTTELGFEAPVYKDIKISGSISQSPTNKLMGSFETPFPTTASPYARNAVNAWWQDDCVGGVPCTRWQGSKSFHGTVAQGLWELNPTQLTTFRGFVFSSFLSTN